MRVFGFRSALLAASSLAGICTIVQGEALAQTTSVEKDESPQVAAPSSAESESEDVLIVVPGFRQSLTDALNIKRRAGTVVDAISAEDIGKSTDQNIAEAMQRITGIAINRADGEGTTVTVRGAGPDLNNVTLNGVTLTSGNANQGVDFSTLSSDILRSIKVNKTASASQDEGSLGGSIELETFKPLDARTNRRAVDIQSRYDSFGDNGDFLGDDVTNDYRINGAFSQKFFNDSLGVSIVATQESQSLRRDQYNNTWFNANTYAQGATDITTGEIIRGFDYDGDGTVEIGTPNAQGVYPVAVESLRGRENRQQQYSYFRNRRDRTSVTGTLQWRPTDSTDIYFDATFSEQYVDVDESRIEHSIQTLNNDPSTIFFDPTTLTFVENIFQQRFSTSNTGQLRQPGVIRMYRQTGGVETDNVVIGGGVKQRFGNLELELKGGRSYTESADDDYLLGRAFVPRTNNLAYSPFTVQTAATASSAEFFRNGYSCQPNPQICSMVLNEGLADNPAVFQPQIVSLRQNSFTDEAWSAYFDVKWDLEFGPLRKLSAGVKYQDRIKENQSGELEYSNAALGGGLNLLNLSDFTDGSVPTNWGEQLGFARDSITDGWFLWDLQATLDQAFATNGAALPEFRPNLRGIRDIQQTVWAGYAQADFAFFDDRVFGDVGVRYARTEVVANGFSGFQFSAINFFNAENIAYYGSLEAAQAALGQNTFDSTGLPGSGGNASVTPPPTATQGTNSYDDVLPSVNVNWAVTDRLVARGAVSKTIGRPRFDSLAPGFTINELIFAEDSVATFGGTNLLPFRSTNVDVSLEWYFAKGSLLSIALFDKKLSDFEETGSYLSYWRDIRGELFSANGAVLPADQINFVATPDLLLPVGSGLSSACLPNRELDLRASNATPPLDGTLTQCDTVNVSQARNGQGGYVRGVEVQFQHNLTYLSGALSGIGMLVNYTYADSETEEEIQLGAGGEIVQFFPALPLEGTSQHTANATLFYERNGKLLRLAYNTRTDYLTTRSARDGNAFYIEGFDTLDVSAGWKLSKNVSLNFQAQNVLDTVTRTYATNVLDSLLPTEPSALSGNVTKDRTVSLVNTGPIYRLGLRIAF